MPVERGCRRSDTVADLGTSAQDLKAMAVQGELGGDDAKALVDSKKGLWQIVSEGESMNGAGAPARYEHRIGAKTKMTAKD